MTLNAYSYNAQPSVNPAWSRGTIAPPIPSPVVTSKAVRDSALACLTAMSPSDPSIRIMRSDAINGIRSGNVSGCYELALWIYTTGWSTSNAEARAVGHCVARYVYQMVTLMWAAMTSGSPTPSIDVHSAYVLFSHF